MLISPFVLLMCGLVAEELISKMPPQPRMCIPTSFTADMPFLGSDKVQSDLAFTLCGDKQNHCAAFGHPV